MMMATGAGMPGRRSRRGGVAGGFGRRRRRAGHQPCGVRGVPTAGGDKGLVREEACVGTGQAGFLLFNFFQLFYFGFGSVILFSIRARTGTNPCERICS